MVFGGGLSGIHIFSFSIANISAGIMPRWISHSGCNGTILYLTIDYNHMMIYGVGTMLARWSVSNPYSPVLMSNVSIGNTIQPGNIQGISVGPTGVYIANKLATTGTFYGLGI